MKLKLKIVQRVCNDLHDLAYAVLTSFFSTNGKFVCEFCIICESWSGFRKKRVFQSILMNYVGLETSDIPNSQFKLLRMFQRLFINIRTD